MVFFCSSLAVVLSGLVLGEVWACSADKTRYGVSWAPITLSIYRHMSKNTDALGKCH